MNDEEGSNKSKSLTCDHVLVGLEADDSLPLFDPAAGTALVVEPLTCTALFLLNVPSTIRLPEESSRENVLVQCSIDVSAAPTFAVQPRFEEPNYDRRHQRWILDVASMSVPQWNPYWIAGWAALELERGQRLVEAALLNRRQLPEMSIVSQAGRQFPEWPLHA